MRRRANSIATRSLLWNWPAIWMASLLSFTPSLLLAELHAGQLLRDALVEINNDGVALFFSSEVVHADMRVVETPKDGDPLQMVRDILAPHGLSIEPAPGGRWLVTQLSEDDGPQAEGEDSTPSFQSGEANLRPVDEVLVIGGRYQIYGNDQVAEFDHEAIDRLPHLADDLMRAISRLPAATADDFSARINMRGGTRDETAVYLDGLRLVDPFHLKDLQGALSIVDSNLIDHVDVLPGGFQSNFGDAASGIVNIRTLPAPEKNVHSVGVSFINAFANTRGSFDDGRGGWLVSIRRGYLDWLFRLVDTGTGEFTPRYLDFLAKIEHEIGERHIVSGHVLAAEDDLKFFDDTENTQVDGSAETLFLWGRLRSAWTNALTSESILWRNTIDRRRDVMVDDPNNITANVTDLRDIEVSGLRSDWQWRLDDGWSVAFGAEATDINVDYDYTLMGSNNNPGFPGQPPIARRTLMEVDGGTLQLYSAVRKTIGRSTTELGWRYDKESYTGLDESTSAPRLNIRFDLSPATKILLAWGDFSQFQPAESLQVEDGIDEFGRATEAEHRIIGLEHSFNPSLSLRVDAYHKRYRQLRPRFVNLFDSYEPIPEAEADRYRVDANSADARGIEVSLKRRAADGFSWWASYSYSEVEELVDGTDVPREWDQPHALNVVFNWEFARWNLNLASAWHSGWPRTDAGIGTVDMPGGQVLSVVPGTRNADRYDDYLRIDARISREVKLQRGNFIYFFELYNLLDSQNPCCIDELTLVSGPSLQFNEEYWLPLMPSFGFTWTFE